MDLRVLPCPSCGAPLPAAQDGEHVTCSRCGASTTTDGGRDAVLEERASRQEAEALFATLGRPPSWSQKTAVVLTNGWVWLFGFPFVLAILVRVGSAPLDWFAPWWEHRHRERLLHVVSPMVGWLLQTGPSTLLAVAILAWSLLGARIDARRGLQAALASRPPRVAGGPAACRNCGGDLVVAADALGARCRYCAADNLVALPARWIARTRKIEVKLRLSTDLARKAEAEGRRRVLRAASWRVPLVVLFVLLGATGARRMAGVAGWRDMRLGPGATQSVYQAMKGSGDGARLVLRSIARCDRAEERAALRGDSELRIDDDVICEGRSCRAPALVALAADDDLVLAWTAPAEHVEVRFAIAPVDWVGGLIGQEGFGDPIATADLAPGAPGDVVFRARAPVSGWYYVGLHGAPGAAVEPCVERDVP